MERNAHVLLDSPPVKFSICIWPVPPLLYTACVKLRSGLAEMGSVLFVVFQANMNLMVHTSHEARTDDNAMMVGFLSDG